MSLVYNPEKYQPHLGGHAPGHLRDAFVAAVDAFEAWNDGEPEPIVEVGYRETPITISAVFGLLWNCSDIMPGWLCQQIEDLMPHGRCSTYAQGVRLLKARI
jgi:hypothetical protein